MNSMKHSGQQIALVTERKINDLYEFKIIDYGIGFNIEHSAKELHYGISNMQERAKQIGAELTINSTADEGTTITVIIPRDAEK